MKQQLIDLSLIKIPKKITFFKPNFLQTFTAKAHSVLGLSYLGQEDFLNIANEKGKKIKLEKLNEKLIKNKYDDINQCVPWKILKLKQECDDNYPMPVLIKKNNEYLVVDGNTLIGVFYHFKREKDIYVWLIDLDMDDKSIFKKYKKESDKTQILTPYNYGTIKDNEKVLMLDVIRLIENKQTIEEVKNALDTIKITFDIKNVVKYDMEKSPFLNICKENDLKPTVQGFIHINQNNKKYEYPIIGLMDDIRKLEKFLENLIKNYVIRK
jgi:hypothetical protein